MGFKGKVYALCKLIPKGKVSTYGEIAKKLKSSPRAVGQALKVNPYLDVPCHRVVNSDGKIGGYRGIKDSKEKMRILKKEGVKIDEGIISSSSFWSF